MRALRLAGAGALALACAACSSQLSALQGERTVTQWIAPPAAGATGASGAAPAASASPTAPAETLEVPAVFTLKNPTMGPITVQSVRAPVGVEVSTIPPLPATIRGGATLEVAVIARFRRDRPEAVRRILLETANQPPLELLVQARMKPEGAPK
ncbi:MAG: hypothetical protein U0625_12005 [Phycisphaerales bacterium]